MINRKHGAYASAERMSGKVITTVQNAERNLIGAKMSDLIDREKFIYTLIFSEKTKSIFVKDLRSVIEVANEMPSAEPAERKAKVIEHDASVTDTDSYKYHRSEYLCGACKKRVLGGDEYCSHCGVKLDWSE